MPSNDGVQDGNSLEESLSIVRSSKSRMVQCLDNAQLMDGLKHASTMLSELRTSSLGPKQYYELYMSVFDALGYLSNYLKEAHNLGRHHLADLYELVQYAGSIVPRLYLMITVGSVYMGMEGAPIKEIMRDMMEMSRGVQQPIRGLFLRHYLSGQTKDYMPVGTGEGPEGNLQDSIQFTLTNLIEMNKLWVRLQHQGHSRERQQRELERTELKTLVGTNLVRLSQLEGIDLTVYTNTILPAVLEQVIQCRDILAQEYLLEVITQVYPDEYHLRTLDQFLSAIAKLNPHVNVKQIVIQIIDRLAAFAAREAENEDPEKRKQKEENSILELEQKIKNLRTGGSKAAQTIATKSGDDDHTNLANGHKKSRIDFDNTDSEHFRGIPNNVKLFEIFWQQITGLVQARPDLKIQDISAMLVSLCNLALSCYPANLEYIDQIMNYARERTLAHADSTDLHSNEARENLSKLLLTPLSGYTNLLTVLAIPAYLPLLQAQSYLVRRAIASTVATTALSRGKFIDNAQDAEGLFDLLNVVLSDHDRPVGPQHNGSRDSSRRLKDADSDEVLSEQGWLARLVHLLHSEDLDVQFKMLQIARKALSESGERVKYTYPSLIMASLKLGRKWKSREHLEDDWSQKCGSLYKFVHQTISTLYQRVGYAETTMRLFIFAGQMADQGGFEEVAYEFFAQAFTIYEEAISESKAQFQAVAMMASALQQTRCFSRDNYDTLITKCALHGAKLLKKPDQTRAILIASHLWWTTDIPARGEEDEKSLYRDDKRVLECLQKALKIADACMDTATSIQLFIEILNQYIYYFDKQNEAIAPKFINGLIDLIRQNMENMEPSAGNQRSSMISTSALSEPEDTIKDYITKHFDRTLQHIQARKEDEESDHWAPIL